METEFKNCQVCARRAADRAGRGTGAQVGARLTRRLDVGRAEYSCPEGHAFVDFSKNVTDLAVKHGLSDVKAYQVLLEAREDSVRSYRLSLQR